MGRHGGGAFSGKDPTKVDRSAAYMARYVAKNIVAAGLAERCEIQLAYAIGVPSRCRHVDTWDRPDRPLADRRAGPRALPAPGAFIKHLDLRRPIYRKTASGGHFGRADEFTWERTDKADVPARGGRAISPARRLAISRGPPPAPGRASRRGRVPEAVVAQNAWPSRKTTVGTPNTPSAIAWSWLARTMSLTAGSVIAWARRSGSIPAPSPRGLNDRTGLRGRRPRGRPNRIAAEAELVQASLVVGERHRAGRRHVVGRPRIGPDDRSEADERQRGPRSPATPPARRSGQAPRAAAVGAKQGAGEDRDPEGVGDQAVDPLGGEPRVRRHRAEEEPWCVHKRQG